MSVSLQPRLLAKGRDGTHIDLAPSTEMDQMTTAILPFACSILVDRGGAPVPHPFEGVKIETEPVAELSNLTIEHLGNDASPSTRHMNLVAELGDGWGTDNLAGLEILEAARVWSVRHSTEEYTRLEVNCQDSW